MTEKNLVCINCPMGCRLTATIDNGVVVAVTGNTCKRGKEYAETECVNPVRTVTTLVRVEGREEPLPVRTSKPVPKGKMLECAEIAKKTVVKMSVKIGDVIISGVAGTDADLIAASNADGEK